MPSKYVIRSFEEDSAYHVFNRGVEKRSIFQDDEDYEKFIKYMRIYLSPLDKIVSSFPYLDIKLQARNLNKDLDLVAYCLMPNHFHFLLFQKTKDAISRFMKQQINAYTKYFNEKYQRTGNLLEGRFKAAPIKGDDLLIHISRYIHLNPVIARLTKEGESFRWSSLKCFLEKRLDFDFVEPGLVLTHFKDSEAYKKFVEDQIDYGKQLAKIKLVSIDAG